MIDVSDRIFWIRDGKVDRIEIRAEVAGLSTSTTMWAGISA